MNPAGHPRSSKRLANKRRQLKLKILLLQERLSTLEEDQQLPSMPEFRVFAKNIERFYGELDRVLREIEDCDSFADERDAHDMECAAIEGLLQGVNNKIVALSLALLSKPHSPALAVSQQVAIPTPLFTNDARGEGECTGDCDVPERTDLAAADAKVCAPIQLLSSPSNATTERGDPLCTRCNGCHLSTDCFVPSEVPLGQSHETNSNLKAFQSMPDSPAEPEVVQHEASTRVRGDVDMSGDSGVPPTLRSEERIRGDLDVGWCQPVELGSLLPADAEREDAKSDDPRQGTAGLVDEDRDIATNQAVKDEDARSLQPAEADEVNDEDRSLPINAQPVCTSPAVQEDAATKPSHKSETYSCQLYNANVARSTDRVRAARKFTEKLLQSVIFTNNEKQSLVAEQRTYTELMVWLSITGFFRGVALANFTLCVSEYSSLEKLPAAFGWHMVGKGVFVILFGPLIGAIRDWTDSYPICIHVQSVCIFTCVAAWCVEFAIKRLRTKKVVEANPSVAA
ncbi:monocarboxylate transporter [Culex quinquefasciatus]|uniref:Monocarboxylate transporter n=1 Tax=Culex quinquefasciatus TaxID=7176 RepID=B0WMB7_CULQU|nr:monocarboxylate transporter [Culex quinquefasciatus]|eukprot:XP_001849851.1 monocarboxylate transporter [Culex quinquefasciatus]